MRVFLTGGTGSIGSSVVTALLENGHEVVALARSDGAERKLVDAGCRVVRGDIAEAGVWMPVVTDIDGVIHLAATFGPDMASADAAFVDALCDWGRGRGGKTPVIYTGGIWDYGPVGDNTAIEGSPFDPPPDFAYSLIHRARLFDAPGLSTRIVHPAMVWSSTGGVIEEFIAQAKRGEAIKVTGSMSVRWPLVHCDDLSRLYVLALEKGTANTDYHGVAQRGVEVGAIASAIAERFHAPGPVVQPVEEAVAELGSWAACRAYDQTMDAPLTRAHLGWTPVCPDILSVF